MNCSCSPPKEKQTMHSLQQSPFLYPQTLRVCFNKWNEDKGHGKTTSDGHLLLGHQPLSLQAFHLVVVNWFVAVSVARCQGKVMDLGPPQKKKCCFVEFWHSNLGFWLADRAFGDFVFGRSHRTLSSY